jgi:O-antigen/teichoic acid export membrane protein
MTELDEDAASPPSEFAPANADNRAVARNALAGYAAWAINLAIGLAVTPILLRRLGVEAFGAWTIAVATAGYVGAVELGLGVATVRQVASALAVGDARRVSIVGASARATYLAMAGVGAGVLAGLVMLPGVLIETSAVSSGELRLVVLLLGLGQILPLVVSVYPTIAIGAGRADLATGIGIGFRVLTAAAQVTAVVLSKSLVPLALVTAAGAFLGTLGVRNLARRHFTGIDVRLSNARRGTVRELLASGWRNAGITLAAATGIQSDVIVAGAIVGPAAAAAYGIAVRASTMARELATRTTDALVPTFAHSTALQDTRRTVAVFRESVVLERAILVPALVVVTAFGNPLLRLWLGEVPHGAKTVLVLLVLGAFLVAPGHSSFVLLTGMGRLTYLLAGAWVTAVANLGLSILLTWRFGIVGPVIGNLAGFVVWDMVVLPRHVGSLLGISWVPLSAAGLRILALPALVAAALAWGAVQGLEWRSSGEGLLGSAVVGLAYVAVLSVTLGAERRARYHRLLAGAMSRRRSSA